MISHPVHCYVAPLNFGLRLFLMAAYKLLLSLAKHKLTPLYLFPVRSLVKIFAPIVCIPLDVNLRIFIVLLSVENPKIRFPLNIA